MTVLAILAKERKSTILTLDKHLKEIQKELGIKLLPL